MAMSAGFSDRLQQRWQGGGQCHDTSREKEPGPSQIRAKRVPDFLNAKRAKTSQDGYNTRVLSCNPGQMTGVSLPDHPVGFLSYHIVCGFGR